eukprot:TRINITY_DN3091_c0_g1_i1.p1 TRINITY_DN3091_c0_g1~~TRINITY_DN3091_c0_g1_i1.p1  ORF type:complete len:132 (+),score=17.91 TRINITY_DN3091_c0_g1_i1:113-508(+)
MWLVDLVYQLLTKFGFFSRKATVVMLGLDNAGKTTLLSKLKHGIVRQFAPTERAYSEQIKVGNVSFTAWDVGGHLQARALWKNYVIDAQAIVFLIDSNDRERFEESKKVWGCAFWLCTSADRCVCPVCVYC